MRYLLVMNSRLKMYIGKFSYCFGLIVAFAISKQIHSLLGFLCSDVVIRPKGVIPKQLSLMFTLWCLKCSSFEEIKDGTHPLLYVRCSAAEPSGREDRWIQKPTTKQAWSPTLLLELSQLSSADVGKVGKNDGWTRRRRTEQNHSDLSIHTQRTPPTSSSSPPTLHPSCPTTFTQVHRSFFFRLQENFQPTRLALQLYRDIAERMNVLKIWEERCLGLTQQPWRPWKH